MQAKFVERIRAKEDMTCGWCRGPIGKGKWLVLLLCRRFVQWEFAIVCEDCCSTVDPEGIYLLLRRRSERRDPGHAGSTSNSDMGGLLAKEQSKRSLSDDRG